VRVINELMENPVVAVSSGKYAIALYRVSLPSRDGEYNFLLPQ